MEEETITIQLWGGRLHAPTLLIFSIAFSIYLLLFQFVTYFFLETPFLCFKLIGKLWYF